MKWLTFILAFSPLILNMQISHAENRTDKINSWLCFYGGEFPAENIPKFDLYILDSINHPQIEPLKNKGSKVVGYLSLGEIAKHNWYFEEMKAKNIFVEENENWPGAFRIDIKNKKWLKSLIKEIIPEILARGFDGLFLDTIDTAEYLETQKGVKGSIKGAVKLIKQIRKKFPNIIIVLNNGLFLTDMVGDEIDALVVEDIYTTFDFKNKKYSLTSEEWTRERLAPIKLFQETFQKPVLALDYVSPGDKKTIEKISEMARSQNLIPYISTIELDKIFFHPQ
ncbi:MAG: endo alpha-1,4 polygalactosaminidase [Pseudomonadota bacterium]